MVDEYDYHRSKRADKTYISKSIAFKDQDDRRIRIASKVMDSSESHSFALEQGEHVIRIADGGRQEIVAKFYEDTRGVFVLTLQRFSTDTGVPHRTHFSFVGNEIARLLEFIEGLQLVELKDRNRLNVTDAELKRMLLSPEQVKQLILQNQAAVLELARSDITTSDVVALGYRRKQLEEYDRLLHDRDYFLVQEQNGGRGSEAVWQQFFERNKWIFGYGLTFVVLSALNDRKLEQTVIGSGLGATGKRADALMKSRGAIESLCFVEIKAHTTPLLKRHLIGQAVGHRPTRSAVE